MGHPRTRKAHRRRYSKTLGKRGRTMKRKLLAYYRKLFRSVKAKRRGG